MTSTPRWPRTRRLRRPQVAKIQDSARPSLSWWEHFGRYHDASRAWQFAYHFFTRRSPTRKLRRRDPDFVGRARRGGGPRYGADAAGQPRSTMRRSAPCPAAWSRSSDRAVRLGRGPAPLSRCGRARPADGGGWALDDHRPGGRGGPRRPRSRPSPAAPAAGAALVAVRGGTPLTRRLLCEEARLGHGTPALLIDGRRRRRHRHHRGPVRPRRPRARLVAAPAERAMSTVAAQRRTERLYPAGRRRPPSPAVRAARDRRDRRLPGPGQAGRGDGALAGGLPGRRGGRSTRATPTPTKAATARVAEAVDRRARPSTWP